MKQTIAAVFDDTVTAQLARDDLLSAGFGRDAMQLSGNGVASAGGTPPDPEGTRDVFATLFGRDDTRTETYMTAVARGNCVLTLTLMPDEVARAEAIIDRHRPLSLDEHADDVTEAPWMSGEQYQGEMAPSMARDDAASQQSQAVEHRARPRLGSRMGLDEGLGHETADFGEGYSASMGMITEGQGLHMEEPPMTRLIWPRHPAPRRAPLDDEHEEAFRAHHADTFGGEGEYDEYAQAYRYGASMSRDAQLGTREWHEAEPELRSRWERHEDSTWLRFKEAVRHGWDRLRHH